MALIKILLLFLLDTGQASGKFLCKNYKMDYVLENKIENTTIRGCLKQSHQFQFVSEDCQTIKCPIIKKIRKKKWKVPMPYPRQGSPHFMACYEIKGSPIIVNITAKKRRKFSLCRIDDSFIDAYTLMLHVKKKVDRQKRKIKKRKKKSFKLKIE